jgi:toxin FitB
VIGWLIDTNVTAELISAGGERRVKAWAAAQEERTLFLSILTLGEYDKGINNLDPGDQRRSRYAKTCEALEARFADRLLPISNAVVRRWGAISGAVKRTTGHSPSVIDTMLAATALVHDMYFVTRNVRDVQYTGAAVFNPWTDDSDAFPVHPLPRRWRPSWSE